MRKYTKKKDKKIKMWWHKKKTFQLYKFQIENVMDNSGRQKTFDEKSIF